MRNTGVFYSLLDKVGAEGRYQNISLLFWSLSFITIGGTTFYKAYLFHQDNYSCPNSLSEDCHQFVCSLPL